MLLQILKENLVQFWYELPTRLFLILFMFSDEPGYGRGAWYKSLGPRQPTPREIEDSQFAPNNYRTGPYGNAGDTVNGYNKLIELRNIELFY